MNWVDILLLAIIGVSVIWGVKTGILSALFGCVGALVGMLLAGAFSDDISGVASSVPFLETFISAAAYWVIVGLTIYVAAKASALIKPALSIGTLGVSGMLDRMGGFALGLVVGLALSFAAIAALARVSFDFPLDAARDTGAERVDQVMDDLENRREAISTALRESTITPIFLDASDALPDDLLGLAPQDFRIGLDMLKQPQP